MMGLWPFIKQTRYDGALSQIVSERRGNGSKWLRFICSVCGSHLRVVLSGIGTRELLWLSVCFSSARGGTSFSNSGQLTTTSAEVVLSQNAVGTPNSGFAVG